MRANEKTEKSTNKQEIWFDGVNKHLLEVHSTQKAIVPATPDNLLTMHPLKSYKYFSKKAVAATSDPNNAVNDETKQQELYMQNPHDGITDEVALDCEMVECNHHKNVVARVSIVNLFGHVLLDSFVAPPSKVTDYRTRWSGVRPKNLVDAPNFDLIQEKVKKIINGRVVVGHAVHNDFTVLKVDHPPEKIRDTSLYYKFLFGGNNPSLKRLTERLLGIKIQKGEHDSVQDAQATMKCFLYARDKWNRSSTRYLIARSSSQLPQRKKLTKLNKPKPISQKIKTFYVANT